MPTQPLPQLDYATNPTPWIKRKQVRRSIGAIVVLSILLACAHWLYPAIPSLRLAYHRHECMNYTAPPDRVVYEADPAKAETLIESDARYRIFEDNAKSAGVFSCRAWEIYKNDIDGIGDVLFLHARRRPDGAKRLVAVLFSPPLSMSGLYPFPYVEPPSKNQSSHESGRGLKKFRPLANDRTLRVFAGQPDPTDESHFTIVYEAHDQRGTIDGYLQNDDSITLTIRDGPAR